MHVRRVWTIWAHVKAQRVVWNAQEREGERKAAPIGGSESRSREGGACPRPPPRKQVRRAYAAGVPFLVGRKERVRRATPLRRARHCLCAFMRVIVPFDAGWCQSVP